jgi:hypothetical protein
MKEARFPESTKTSHQRFRVGEYAHKRYMTLLLKALADFHEYAEANNILYSLGGGSLIGFFWNGQIIPWDDDIDIFLGQEDFFKIKKNLWCEGKKFENEGKFNSGWKREGGFKMRNNRLNNLSGNAYHIAVNTISNTSKKQLMKILPTEKLNRRLPGGLDILCCMNNPDGSSQDSWTLKRTCCGPTDKFLAEDCPIVSFSGVKTRAVKREIAEPFLNRIYGKKWVIPCHPKLKKSHGR